MKATHLTNKYYSKVQNLIQSIGLLFLFVVTSQLGQAQGIGIAGNGGNPLPNYCQEPCNTMLSRWFNITIDADPGNPLTITHFTFEHFYFHPTINDLNQLAQPTNMLTILGWTPVETLGPYPNGNPHPGIEIGGNFYPFDGSSGVPTIPGGGSGTITLWLDMYGCYTQGGVMPTGYYSMDIIVHTLHNGDIVKRMEPTISCGNWNDRMVSKAVISSSVASLQATPNPVLDRSLITFDLSDESMCSLNLYNLQGQKVMTLMNEQLISQGTHKQSFNLGDLPAGVYFAKLETPLGIETVRILKQ